MEKTKELTMIGKAIVTLVCLTALSGFAEEISLEKDLMPLFKKSCADCHNPESTNRGAIKNKTFFATKEDILGKVGTHIKAGEPEESGLMKVLDQTAKFGKRNMPMPPPKSELPKFSEEDLKKVSDWIKAGAQDN
jgi:mono/diheme cytochrome c family protein